MSTATDHVATLNVQGATQSNTDSEHLSVYRLIETQAGRASEAIAVTAPGRAPMTYGSLCRQIEQITHRLNSTGIGRNDCVAVVLADGPEAAVAYLGVVVTAACAPLNPRYRASEFDFYLRNLNAKALIVQAGIDTPARAIAQEQQLTVIELSPVLEAEAGTFTLDATERARALHDGFAEGEEVALLLYTSGTTSRSKLVPLTQANVCAAARKVQAALELTSADRYLNVTPLFYSQGIMLTISSLCAGASVVCTHGFSAAHFFKWIEEFHPTWYSAAPATHQAIVAYSRNNRVAGIRRSLRFIRSAAAPLPLNVRTELERLFRSPVIESYGMTECYPISSNPLPPGKRKPGSAGVPAGTEIAVIDEVGNLLPQGKTGEIVVSGAQVMRGYLNDMANNSQSFVDRWFRTGDMGYIDADGYLFVTGRLKEVINRGGEKISPREVDEALLQHPAISDAATFSVPHATLGEDVAAVVVLRDNSKVSEREIWDFAATRLAPFKVPRQLLIVDEIPKSATGKIQRLTLAEKFGLSAPAQTVRKVSAAYSPQPYLEEKLSKIWARVLGTSIVGLHNNFFDLGGNSLLAIQLAAQIEQAFHKGLPLTAVFQAPTIEQLANILRREKWRDSWSALVPLTASGSEPPFFWVHGDSSNGLLAEYLGSDQPLYALEHQAHDGKPPRYVEAKTIAAYYIDEISRVQSSGPSAGSPLWYGGIRDGAAAKRTRRSSRFAGLA